jgi:hypothetical protein
VFWKVGELEAPVRDRWCRGRFGSCATGTQSTCLSRYAALCLPLFSPYTQEPVVTIQEAPSLGFPGPAVKVEDLGE